MSADNGFVIRKNVEEKFVLQHYCASADNYPPIEKGVVYPTLEEAVLAYVHIESEYFKKGYPLEYGLSFHIDEVTPAAVDLSRPMTDPSI